MVGLCIRWMGFSLSLALVASMASCGPRDGASSDAELSERDSPGASTNADGGIVPESADSREDGPADGPSAGSLISSGSFVHLPIPWGDNDPILPGTETEFPEKTAALIADIEGDGVPEVIVSTDERRWPRVFRWDAEAQALVAAPDLLIPDPEVNFVNVCAAADVDGDTKIDFVMGHNDYAQPVPGEPGHLTSLYHLNEDGSVRPGVPFPDVDGVVHEIISGGVLDLVDLDQDGWLDILYGDGVCDGESAQFSFSQHAILRVAEDRFERRNDLFEKTWKTLPETIFMRPLGPDPLVGFVAGHNCSDAAPMEGFYQYSLDEETGYPRFSPFDPTPVESVYKRDPFVSYGPITKQSPMGAAIADFHHDGQSDLAGALFDYYAIMEATARWPFVDRTEAVGVLPPPGLLPGAGASPKHTIPWGMAPVDVDLDGFTDLIVAHGDDHSSYLESGHAVGDHRTVVLRNLGGFAFEEIADEVGLGKWGNWRALSIGDLNRDGRADVIVGGVGLLPHVYLNAIETPHHGFGIELRGTSSNHLGIGAKVEVIATGVPPQTQIMGNAFSPLITSEPILFFGTGLAENVDQLRVTWPSGHVQELHDLKASGVHRIEEPPIIALDPITRHAPADGKSTVEVRVWPRNASGEVISGEVTIDTLVGQAAFAGVAEVQADGSWVRTLVAPTEVGSSVIVATIDGVAIQVRPRIRWDSVEKTP